MFDCGCLDTLVQQCDALHESLYKQTYQHTSWILTSYCARSIYLADW